MYRVRGERLVPAALLLSAALVSVAISYAAWPVVLALLIMPIAMLWPVEVALGTFALLVPFEPILLLANRGTTLNWIIGAGTGAVLLGTGLATGRLEPPVRPALWWTIFIGWSLFTVFWAFDVSSALARVPTAVALFMLYFVVACYRVDRQELSFVFLMTILGGIAAAGYSVWQFTHGIRGIGALGSYAARATLAGDDRFANPNYFASSLLLPLSLAMGLFLSAKKLSTRVFMLGAVATIGFGVLLTMSRGVLAATAAMMLVYFYRFRIRITALIPVALLALLLFAMPDLFFARVQESVASRAQGRFDIWRVGLEALKHYGLWGAGLGNFPNVYDVYAGMAPNFMKMHRSPHNAYLGVWVETGILGLAAFFIAGWTQLREIGALVKSRGQLGYAQLVACEAAVVGILVHCLVAEIQWTKSFWLVSFLAAIVIRLQRDTAAEAQLVVTSMAGSASAHYFRRSPRVGRS